MIKKTVLIVMGGNSRERDISIQTGKACLKAIKKLAIILKYLILNMKVS